MKTLKPIVLYQNTAIIQRIQMEHNLNETEAKILFEDIKQFLALSVITSEHISPTGMIDKAWHEFLAFTEEYATFCYGYLGKFVHHVPFGLSDDSRPEKAERACLLAEEHFGNLSKNWSLSTLNAGDYSPDTNCESSPSDCASNISQQKLGWPTQQQAVS